MPRPKILPSDQELKRLVDMGLTHGQIAVVVYANTGERVARSSVSVALSRAGMADRGNRYQTVIPWRVKEIHTREYPVLMLRLYGRRMQGKPLTSVQVQRLENWLARLQRDRTVVAYSPDAPRGHGFSYVPREDTDTDLPIRRQPLRDTTN